MEGQNYYRNYNYLTIKPVGTLSNISVTEPQNIQFNTVAANVIPSRSYIYKKFVIPGVQDVVSGIQTCQSPVQTFEIVFNGQSVLNNGHINEQLIQLAHLDFTQQRFDTLYYKKNFMNKTDALSTEGLGKYSCRKLIEIINQQKEGRYQYNKDFVSLVKFTHLSNGGATIEIITPIAMLLYHSWLSQNDKIISWPNAQINLVIAPANKFLVQLAATGTGVDANTTAQKVMSKYSGAALTSFECSIMLCTQDIMFPIPPAIEMLTQYVVTERFNSSSVTIQLHTNYLYLQRIYFTICKQTATSNMDEKVIPGIYIKTGGDPVAVVGNYEEFTYPITNIRIDQGQRQILNVPNMLDPIFRQFFQNYMKNSTQLELETYLQANNTIMIDYTLDGSLGMQLSASTSNLTFSFTVDANPCVIVTCVYLRSLIIDNANSIYGYASF